MTLEEVTTENVTARAVGVLAELRPRRPARGGGTVKVDLRGPNMAKLDPRGSTVLGEDACRGRWPCGSNVWDRTTRDQWGPIALCHSGELYVGRGRNRDPARDGLGSISTGLARP